ncbi:hypothetical protein ACVIGB_008862 [Bradyrhizobium sp. USDA 4341]
MSDHLIGRSDARKQRASSIVFQLRHCLSDSLQKHRLDRHDPTIS